jgi:hypothetical protein
MLRARKKKLSAKKIVATIFERLPSSSGQTLQKQTLICLQKRRGPLPLVRFYCAKVAVY